MPTEADPIVGNWYQHLDKGQAFEVVAMDEEQEVAEIQFFDGNVEEIELDAWYEMDIEPMEAPEDWTGPMDDIERDDLGYTTTTDMAEDDWSRPLREVKGPPILRLDEEPSDDEEDDWGEGRPEEEPWDGED